jgi:signal transduction histidine kinase
VAIKKDIDEDDLIQGNRPLLVTAFSNIIKNCIEARARTIKISTHKKAKKVRIDIADDGKGIDRAIIDEIFDPFFSKKGQSGIGLYLTKRIVELHDGKIELIRNRYTIFSVILPA